jgi:ribosomal protein S18 acetylase RimI-like enzyme
MTDIQLIPAEPKDSETLADVSARAFHSDVLCGGAGEGGPPGYNSPQWQAMIMKKADYYSVILNDKIIGGAIVFRKKDGQYHLGRIFIDPELHRKGLGAKAMQMVLDRYPYAKRWTLETPPWNTRTREFYRKQGFRIVGETEEDVFFEKIIRPGDNDSP